MPYCYLVDKITDEIVAVTDQKLDARKHEARIARDVYFDKEKKEFVFAEGKSDQLKNSTKVKISNAKKYLKRSMLGMYVLARLIEVTNDTYYFEV